MFVTEHDDESRQRSYGAQRRRSIQDRITDLHTLLRAAHVPGPYVLVAHSFGGLLLRLYTETFPDDVAALVLIDTTPDNVIFGDSYVRYARQISWLATGAEWAARFGVARVAGALLLRDTPAGMSPAAFEA